MHEVAPKFKWRGLSPKGIVVPFRRKMPGLHTVTVGPLQNGEKDRRVWLFGQRPVSSVLGITDHLDAVSVRHLVTIECKRVVPTVIGNVGPIRQATALLRRCPNGFDR